jgi:hypothetical protein
MNEGQRVLIVAPLVADAFLETLAQEPAPAILEARPA